MTDTKKQSSAHLIGGALSAAIASIIVQPLDVIKTRQQQFPTGISKYTSVL
jgi:hypothetical protein